MSEHYKNITEEDKVQAIYTKYICPKIESNLKDSVNIEICNSIVPFKNTSTIDITLGNKGEQNLPSRYQINNVLDLENLPWIVPLQVMLSLNIS